MQAYGTDPASSPTPPWERDSANHPWVTREVKEVSAALFNHIASGRFSFGTRLPAERELAQIFRQSRNTIRKAIGFLENYGVVARRGVAGTFVSIRVGTHVGPASAEEAGLINVTALTQAISPFEFYVAQSIIEPEIARLATISMSIRDLAKLRTIFSELNEIVADADRFACLEQLFMMSLCHGTRNSAIIGMYRVMNEVRSLPQWHANAKRTLTPERIRQVKLALRSLLTALDHRKVNNAVEYMRLYIASSQEDMIHEAS